MTQSTGLYRSNTDKMIAGVAGGMANSMNIDPALVRIIFIVLALVGGGGILIYVILWAVLPEDDDAITNANYNNVMDENTTNESGQKSQFQKYNQPKKKDDGSLIAGLVLISLGIIFLVIRYFPRIDFSDLWPVILIVIGVVLLRNAFVSRKQ